MLLISARRSPTRLTFDGYLRERHRTLWDDKVSAGCHPYTECEGTRHSRSEPRVWRCCKYWQRTLSNKLNAKEFAIMHGAPVAPLLWASPVIDARDAANFTNVAIKLTNGDSGRQVLLIKEGADCITGARMGHDEIVARVRAMPGYGAPDVWVLAEELLLDVNGALPPDYKFYCFNGLACVFYITDRSRREWVWYDREWRPFATPLNTIWPQGEVRSPPACFGSLLAAVDHLAQQYDGEFVRMDFYVRGNEFYFGEFTHTPLAGPSLSKYTDSANELLGELWSNARQDRLQSERGYENA